MKEIIPNIAGIKRENRDLDLRWGDKVHLFDGRSLQVIEAIDDMVKVVGSDGAPSYIRRVQIKSHYPTSNPAYHAKSNS